MRKIWILRLGLMLLGLALLGFGWADGQAAAIWSKAVRVCMECIGIG